MIGWQDVRPLIVGAVCGVLGTGVAVLIVWAFTINNVPAAAVLGWVGGQVGLWGGIWLVDRRKPA